MDTNASTNSTTTTTTTVDLTQVVGNQKQTNQLLCFADIMLVAILIFMAFMVSLRGFWK